MMEGKGAGLRVKSSGKNSGRGDIHQERVFGDGESGTFSIILDINV